jgi:hypothetical protein
MLVVDSCGSRHFSVSSYVLVSTAQSLITILIPNAYERKTFYPGGTQSGIALQTFTPRKAPMAL